MRVLQHCGHGSGFGWRRQAVGEITRLWGADARPQAARPSEDYLVRVTRLDALRKQAEEIVLAEPILLPPEPGVG